MSSLARFQETFVRGLVSASPMPGLFSSPAVAVYRNTWRKALIDALRDNYRVVAMLIGPEAFQALALEFIGKKAAPSPILAAFGSGFPAFIAAHPMSETLAYLADVARLERFATEAHLAPDADAIGSERLAQLLETEVYEAVGLHPSVRLGWFETPAVTIWKAHQQPEGFGTLAPEWLPEGALVVRRGGRILVEQIGRDTYDLLSQAHASESFGQASEHLDRQASAALLELAGNEAFIDLTKGD